MVSDQVVRAEKACRGGCFCGEVRYEAAARPFDETGCHCADCRRAVGAHVVAWFSVARPALRYTSGSPTRFQSSAAVVRSFCGRCGTSLTYESQDHPDEIDITIASLDDPDSVAPKDHTRTAAKVSWDVLCDNLPAFPGTREGK